MFLKENVDDSENDTEVAQSQSEESDKDDDDHEKSVREERVDMESSVQQLQQKTEEYPLPTATVAESSMTKETNKEENDRFNAISSSSRSRTQSSIQKV